MLSYLSNSTRPEIAYAVHQCARFSDNPKSIHEKAVIQIVKYCITHKHDGIVFNPERSKGIECFADADFAGNWHKTECDDRGVVMSRTGIYITLAGCPIFWKSKLQTEIALSTTEAEYIALSTAMREIIPMKRILQDIFENMGFDLFKSSLKCTIFEDNNGCIELAKSPKMRPRTKHIALKYHFFRDHIITESNPEGEVNIVKVDTSSQVADILTKSFAKPAFERLKNLMGIQTAENTEQL